MTIAVTGANGSVGVSLLRHLAEPGSPAAVACVRSERAASAVPRGPGVTVRVVSYDDVDGLTEALRGADCLVHLAGILIESGDATYEEANVRTTAVAVEAAQRAGVSHLVLISVLGADTASTNAYLRSKGEAERLVAESGLAATILRTPILLGPGTAGGEALARAARSGAARLLGGGRFTLRPLDVDDLSRAVLAACSEPAPGVSVHELVGPEAVLYRDLVRRAGRVIGRDVAIRSLPIGVAKAGAAVMSRLRGGGITPTVIDVITSDEVVESNADGALGVTLTPLGETLEKIFAGAEASR